MGRIALGVSAFLVLAARFVSAQDLRKAEDGRLVAKQLCSECHAVERSQFRSPHERAPGFQAVADAPGMDAMTLRIWLESAHPSMPNLALTEKDSTDLISYILSLKKRS